MHQGVKFGFMKIMESFGTMLFSIIIHLTPKNSILHGSLTLSLHEPLFNLPCNLLMFVRRYIRIYLSMYGDFVCV